MLGELHEAEGVEAAEVTAVKCGQRQYEGEVREHGLTQNRSGVGAHIEKRNAVSEPRQQGRSEGVGRGSVPWLRTLKRSLRQDKGGG